MSLLRCAFPALAAFACAAQSQTIDPISFVDFRVADNSLKGSKKGAIELPIDSKLHIKWDTSAFLSAMIGPSNPMKAMKPLDNKLALVQTGLEVLLDGQLRKLESETANLRLTSDPKAAITGAHRKEAADAQLRLSSFSADALRKVSRHQVGDDGVFSQLRAATKNAKTGDMGALKQAVKSSLESVGADLKAKMAVAQTMDVYMEAWLVGANGKRAQVHLEGYDKVEQGQPRRFPRSRMALDQRTMSELAAAQQIINWSNNLTYAVPQQIEAAKKRVLDAMKILSERLNIEETRVRLNHFIGQLSRMPGDERDDILADAMELKSLLEPFSESSVLNAKTESEGLLKLASLFQNFSINLNTNIRRIPERFVLLIGRMKTFASIAPQIIDADTIAYFQERHDDFVNDKNFLVQVGDSTMQVADVLGFTQEVQQITAELLPKTIDLANLEASLDTELDLTSIKQGAYPGDRIIVGIQVVEKVATAKPEEKQAAGQTLASGQQTLRVEVYGAYLQPRGGLLFVDPRSDISRDLKYEPTVGLGYHYHYGMKGSSFWNHTLNPGLGISFSMLDFNDDQRFEIGAALSMTLFNDLLWVGYGRNFQAKANYFYIGINPMTLGGLFRR